MRGPSATRNNDELTLRGLARFRSTSLLCAMQMVFLPVFSVRLQAQTANVIVPDGRTGTSLHTSGSVTNVTTSTVSGNNAFNSFSQFSVGQGNTVNLQLPAGTQNLVNIVRDAPVYVNGTLNSYMNGAIGGNVYFADPKGFVVGRSGTVNVGSLNVSTPTREFTDSLIGAGGVINQSAVGNLMAGSFPVSPDGNIRIYGRVNAQDGVRLTGQNVYVGGASQRDIANLDHAAKFAASVNSKGLRSASAITVSNGSIRIGAVNNARVNGRLTAHSKTATPSNITVDAGKNIEIGKNARLSAASKTGDAGDIRLKATENLTVAGGAKFDASAKTGNAGLVEFSANGIIDVGNGVSINLAAPNGRAGTLLMDPTDVVVGDASQGDTGVTLSNTSIANTISGITGGSSATYLIQASNSITLAAHAVVDTRHLDVNGHSTGSANHITIDAPNIDIKNGAQILAQAVNFGGTTYSDGNVTLTATASDIKLSGQATAATSITVDGKITGGTISISATSTAVSSFLNGSVAGDFALVGSTLAASLLGLNGGYVAASATATININSHADINGHGDVTISAHATETASDPAVASTLLGSLTPVAAGVVVGKIDGTATTNVASGATVNAGGNLEIKALNDATIAIAALAASTSAQIVPTVAYSSGSVTTTANVATGAHLAAGTVNTSGSTLKVRAINNNSFSTSATSVAAPGTGASGAVGGAFAISDITTSATATLGASLGTDVNTRMNGSVLVEATSDTTLNSTMASSIAGLPALIAAIERGLRAVTSPTSIIRDHMGSLMPLSFDFKVAGALSLANSTQSATAAIAQNPSGGAPSIYASGNVAVASNVIDRGVRSNATSSAITKDPVSGESTAISAAVAWGNFTHNSNAYVGNGTLINAANIAVDATTELPITNTWLKWDGLGAVLSHLNGNLGVGGNILTSYANATADAGDTIGIAGSLNHFVVNNNTTAWVAGSASLTATCTTATCGSSWSVGMDNGDVHTYNASIQIAATTTTASIDAAGNVGTLGFLFGNTSGGSSVGGALNLVQFNTNTIAGVSDRATLRAADDIAVKAITSDRFVAVAPSSGKAAGTLALNGITSLGFLNNTTHASISSQATVYAPTVGILAQQDLSVVTLSGAMSYNGSGGSAVGLSVAYLGANTDTSAYIGDNHSDIRPGVFSSNDPFAGTGGGSGSVNVDNLTISATTSGRITAAAVAASVSDPASSSFSDKAGAAGAASTGGTAGVGTAASKIGSTSGSSTSGFSLDLAGSSSVTDVSLGTSAYIRNTTVNKYTTTSAVLTNTIVQALNDTMLNNGSGSAALNLAGGSAQGAAIGGAIAAAMSNNATLAYIYGTTVNNQSSVTVQALNGGSETVVAIGVAGSKSNAASLSASVGIITDSANAYIESSTITGQATGVNRALEVDAYQTTNIAIGGGSLYITGGQAGVGIGLTYASIADPTGGNATDAHIRSTSISNYDTLLVMADSASVIAAGAASGGAGSNGLAGAIVVSEISPTTTAYINSGATVNINVGRVTVLADSGAVSALDTALGNLVKKSNNNHLAEDTCTVAGGTGGQNCIDFGAAALNGGAGNGPGASIISVAGLIQAGKNNVGASIVYDTIATTHSAYIANVLLTAGVNGNVSVSAVDSSKIQSVTIGFGLATGQFAGVGGTTISSIANTVSAAIGNNLSSASQSAITAKNISVSATDNSSITGTAAVAGASTQGSAAGLALVYSSIANNVSAGVTGSKLTASGNVAVGANSNASISTVAVGIAMSSQVGLAGSVATNLMGTNVSANGNVSNSVVAMLGGQITGTGGTGTGAAVMALDSTTQMVFTGGVTGGAVAVGASVATASRTSSVAARVLNGSTVNVTTLAVGASGAGTLSTTATALGGGIVAGVGADAEAHENSSVLAEIGSSASITTSATGVGTLVSASITPNLSSEAIGVSVGGGAVGVAIAKSTVSATVTADVGDNVSFSGGALAVTAMALVPTGGTTAWAKALAGGGGSLIGAQGSLAQASENATVNAYGGTGIRLPNANVTIAAENDSAQYAEGTGLSTGFLALGATVAQTSSSAHTYAYLGAPADMATLNHGSYTGILRITATGTDTNVSNATVGAGGTYAGAAAVATTSSTAVTNARFDGGTADDTLYFGGLSVKATHTTNYAASGDAYQASTAGVSAGKAQNDVTSTTTAEIGTHLIINTDGGNIVVISKDNVNQAGGGARSGSGGSFSGAAALSDSHVTQYVTTNIGAGTILSLNGDPRTATGVIDIEAYNTLNTQDTASLATASFFAGGGAESNMTANATLAVNINARELFSVGKIFVGTAATMSASNNANASLYGAIAGVGASTNTWVHANQAVNVGSSTTIEAWRDINIYAGMSGDTITFSSVQATATTVVYNNTAIPISTLYRGTANAANDSSLTLADSSRVLGVRDIYLGATQGQVTASGNGSNYNPYLDIFSAKNSDNHSHTSGTGDVALNGLVVAGINNDVTITIDLGAGAPTLSTTSPYSPLKPDLSSPPTLEYVADVDHFSPVKSWNHQTIQYTIVGGFNPYQNIVNQLVTLTGQTATQIRTQLATSTSTHPATMAPSGADPTGDVQRQINALIQQAPYTSDAAGNAFAFGDILVSAGNVSILAQKLSGNSLSGHTAPSVTAQSSPTIRVENRGLDFMDFANLTVTNVTGGNITYRQIDHVDPDSHSNVTFTATPSATPIIDISATYNRVDPSTGLGVDGNGNQLTRKPDIYFDGIVTNENGLLKITSQLGSVVASQSLNAATIQMVAPNGSFIFLGGVGSFYSSNHDVTSQWAGVEYKPADNDTLTAVMAAATYLGAYGAYAYSPHIGDGGNHPYFYYCCVDGHSGVQQTAANSTVFTARMLMTYYDGLSLYSAIFLPMGNGSPNGGGGSVGSTATLAAMEGPTVQPISTAPWERNTYAGQGVFSNTTHDTVTTHSDGSTSTHTDTYYSPFNCDRCSAYFQVVNIQNDVITPRTANTNASTNWASTTPSGYQNPTDRPFILGQAIIISAGVINVNGLIQSGTSSNYSVDIGGGVLSAINSLKTSNNGADFAQAQANARNGSYYDITASATTQFSSDIKIGVRYNALTDQIMVNGVVQGSGGYVYLNGKIISTSTDGTSQGTIAVKGGAGTITVNNSTGLQLVTNTINTGVSAPSVIQIVDQLQQQTTWYVYNPSASGGQQVSTYRTAGVNASSYTAAMLAGMSGTAGIQYTVKPNMYYQWVDTATLDRPTTSTQFDYGWHYTPNASGDNWTRTVSLVENVMQATGGGGNTGRLQTANFQEVVTATGSYHNGGYNTSAGLCCGADGHYDWFQQIYDHLTLTLTNTVKASNPINIQFSGGGASTVNVTSNSGIVINGPINNLSGDTTVIATGANSAITSGANANNPMISGKNVTLSADGGIGTRGTNGVPVQVQVYGGSLKADTIDRDIAIAATGSLSIDHVKVNSAGATPQGSVFLSATGDINSASAYNVANPVVIGKNIEINSTAGAIGATSAVVNGASTLTNINPLVIQATGTIQASGAVDGGVLDSASATGTYIVQSQGDLRLGTIQSTGGPVFLEAAGSDGNQASILNGRAAVGLTQEQSQHLQDVWASLDLLSGNAATNAVNSYQSMVTSAYNDYFQLKNIAFTNGSTYNPTSVGLTVLRAQVAAKLGIDPANVTATQMQVEATTRFLKDQFLLGQISTAELKSSLTTLMGTAPADPLASLFGSSLSTTLFTKLFDGVAINQQFLPTNAALQAVLQPGHFSSTYTYTLASTERVYSIITAGSQWTQSQLAYTVSSSAVGAAPPPIDENVVANVSANQIMLYAPRGSVGNSAAPQTFTFTSVDSSSLTPEQRGLLATAGPGQLTVGAVTDPTTHVTTYTVSLSQQNLVVVDNPIAISAKALTNIYLGSKNSLALGGVTANYGPIAAAQANGIQVTGRGDVKLDAVTSIFANVSGPVISGDIGNLTLIAERGNVGAPGAAGSNPATNTNALQIAFADPSNDQLDQVSSAQGIYVKQTTGDLILGNISAGNAIQLAAAGSIYAEADFTDRTAIHILGTDLDLRAGGNIGFNGSTFQPLQVNISGAVTGSAVGDLSILAVAGDLAVGTSGAYGALTAGGALTLNVPRGALTINTSITSAGLMQLLANRGMTFAAGTSAAPVVATSSSGGVTLVAATLSMGAYSAINAAGLISVTTTGDATIGQLNSSQSYAVASNAPSIIVTAGGVASLGAIIDNGDGQTKFVASGSGAELSLNASNGIGNTTSRLTLSAARLSASASAGDIHLKTLTDAEASLLSAVKGSVDILGTGGLTLDQVLAGTATGASGSFRAVTNNGSIVIGTADSSGSQTVHASQNVTFKSLATTGNSGDAGNINVTADNGFILAQTVTSGGVTTLGSVSAHGSATLLAATTVTGNTLAATTGSGLLTAGGGPINWNVLNVGTTLGMTAGQGSITFQTAQSGGTQTIHARDNVTFNALTATGINGDAGSINVNADNGFILAQTVMGGGVPTLGSVSANGSARLIAAGTNTGHNLTASTGNAVLSGTVVHWDNLNAGGRLDVTATAGGITVGTAISGGTQTLHAVNDIVFSQLTTTGIPGDAGDLNVKSDTGSLRGGSISAHGDTHFEVAGSVSLDRISGDTVRMTSSGDLTIGWVSVVRELDLAADTINVKGEQIRSNPPIPLILNVTGYNGGVAKSANISIDPDSIIVNQFRVVDANFWTDAHAVAILNGYVPGQLMLTTATQQVLLNNRTPAPSNWPTLQLYQPGGVFTMSQVGNANVSNAYVVFYTGDVSATVTNYGPTHVCCNNFTGASMARNISVDGEGSESIETWMAKKDGGTFYLLGLSGQARLDALLTPRPVETIGSGPAVNIEGLSDMRKLRRQGQRAGRAGWKDAAVETAKPAVSRLAEAW